MRDKARVTVHKPDMIVRLFNGTNGEVLEGPFKSMLVHIADYMERGDRWHMEKIL